MNQTSRDETTSSRGAMTHLLLGGVVIASLVLLAGFAFGAETLLAGDDQDEGVHPDDEAGFVLALEGDGDAHVVVSSTFDLEDDERQAFEAVADDESARQAYKDRFTDRMAALAADVQNATEREQSVSDADVDVFTVEETGVVRFSITWHGLAEVREDSLTVSEPFASNYTTDRPTYVVVPDGYEVTSVTPEADGDREGILEWDAGSSLTGFELVLSDQSAADDERSDGTDVDTTDDETTDDDGNGFGVLVGLGGLLGVLLISGRLTASST